MISWVIRQCNRIPPPWNFVTFVALALLFVAIVVALFGQIRSCNYDKARREYEERDRPRAAEIERLKGQIEMRDRLIAELEPKVAVLEEAAKRGQKIDESLAQQLSDITEEAAREEAATDLDTDCRVRAGRTIAKLRALKPPIIIDAVAYERKVCSR